jgi:peptidoglycan-N-acetylglucosamine deacetylase
MDGGQPSGDHLAEVVEQVPAVGDLDWPVVVLHDIENACLARLPDFVARLQDRGFDLRQGFPESVVVTRKGRFVTLSGALVADGPPT